MGQGFWSRLRGPIGLGVIGVVVVAALVVGFLVLPKGQTGPGGGPTEGAKAGGKPGGGGAAVPVQVVTVQAGTLQQKTTLTGEFQSLDKVQIVSRISSRVVKLPADIGTPVKVGDVLVELDRTQLEAAAAQAKAQLASAQANLRKMEAGARPEDIAAARAMARQAEENLANAQVQGGAMREQDIAAAQAALAASEARYESLKNGARAEDLEIATQNYNQARENRERMVSQLSTAKEAARIAVEQATSALRQAQALYGAAKLLWDEAERTDKDPNIPTCKPPQPKNCNDLTDAKRRQYKANYEAAEQAMRQAEQALEARQIAYEDAQRQEILVLQQQDAAVAVAKATLEKLQNGATQLDLDAAKAAVDQARAALARLQASPTSVGVAQAQLDQQQALADKAMKPYLATDLEVANAQVLVAEAGVKAAEANLRDATITAAFAGIVSARPVSEGALASPGTPLLELVSTEVRGIFAIEEAMVGSVNVGQVATLATTAFPGQKFAGTVTTVNPTANAATRSFGLRITPSEGQDRLKAGMFAQAELVTAERQNVVLVPEGAVLTRDGKAIVFVIAENKAQRRDVTTGLRADGKLEVTKGIAAGDKVVIVGQNLLNDGDAVNARE